MLETWFKLASTFGNDSGWATDGIGPAGLDATVASETDRLSILLFTFKDESLHTKKTYEECC